MRLTAILAGLTALTGLTQAGEMEKLMSIKLAQREMMRQRGVFDASAQAKHPKTSKACVNGKAGPYSCKNIDLVAFRSHSGLGSITAEGADIWGWTAPGGREFAAVTQTDGTAFVEIGPRGGIIYIGRLPTQTVNSLWRDVKVINGYAYIGSEAPQHGLQVFNMRKLLNVPKADRPALFSTVTDLTAWYTDFGSSHNIVAHEERNVIYAVGTTRELPCGGGLYGLDVSDPANPTYTGCVSQDGYVHDAQCVIYNGPDTRFTGRDICFNYNEDTLTIVDVTNKANPRQLSKTPYVGASYTHQGWLTDESMSYVLLDDELDELDQTGPAANNHTTTFIIDIKNLRRPKNTGFYQSPVKSIDHNQYVVDGISYQANYNSGLRMVNVRSVKKNPTGSGFREIAFFDVHPEDDAEGGVVEFSGAWSVWPYSPRGYLLVNTIDRGLFVLKHNPK